MNLLEKKTFYENGSQYYSLLFNHILHSDQLYTKNAITHFMSPKIIFT